MKTLNEMNKMELRAACKEAGVKNYGTMNNEQMRAAVQAVRDEAQAVRDQEYVDMYGESHCPHCGLHLGNGVGHHLQDANGEVIHHEQFEFECLGCGKEFGPEITVKAPKVRKPKQADGIKIEKNRDAQNGVSRPSAGGTCRAIWDALDAMVVTGVQPSIKQAKAHAEKEGWSLVTTSIQYYQWRKFHGIRGRQ